MLRSVNFSSNHQSVISDIVKSAQYGLDIDRISASPDSAIMYSPKGVLLKDYNFPYFDPKHKIHGTCLDVSMQTKQAVERELGSRSPTIGYYNGHEPKFFSEGNHLFLLSAQGDDEPQLIDSSFNKVMPLGKALNGQGYQVLSPAVYNRNGGWTNKWNRLNSLPYINENETAQHPVGRLSDFTGNLHDKEVLVWIGFEKIEGKPTPVLYRQHKGGKRLQVWRGWESVVSKGSKLLALKDKVVANIEERTPVPEDIKNAISEGQPLGMFFYPAKKGRDAEQPVSETKLDKMA